MSWENRSIVKEFKFVAKRLSNINAFSVEVGVNDHQAAVKGASIGVTEENSKNRISAYIDMGDYHIVFNYKKRFMSHVVDIINGLDPAKVKGLKLFMPDPKKVLDFNKEPHKTYKYKMGKIEDSLLVKGIEFKISHTPFIAPKVASVEPAVTPVIEGDFNKATSLELVA